MMTLNFMSLIELLNVRESIWIILMALFNNFIFLFVSFLVQLLYICKYYNVFLLYIMAVYVTDTKIHFLTTNHRTIFGLYLWCQLFRVAEVLWLNVHHRGEQQNHDHWILVHYQQRLNLIAKEKRQLIYAKSQSRKKIIIYLHFALLFYNQLLSCRPLIRISLSSFIVLATLPPNHQQEKE